MTVRSRRSPLLLACTLAAVGAWWWWPTLSGSNGVATEPTGDDGAIGYLISQTVDVLMIGDADLVGGSEQIERRIREEGLSVTRALEIGSWCEAADELPGLIEMADPSSVVISITTNGSCADGVAESVAAIGDRRAVLVVQPGLDQPDAVGAAITTQSSANVVVADPSRLLGGDEMPAVVACQWWDDCAPDGTIDIRTADGSLTPAGAERIARVIASVVS